MKRRCDNGAIERGGMNGSQDGRWREVGRERSRLGGEPEAILLFPG